MIKSPKILIVLILILIQSNKNTLLGYEYNMDSTFISLLNKNRNTIEYYRNSHNGLITEKEKLLYGLNINLKPSIDINDKIELSEPLKYNKLKKYFSTKLNGSIDKNDWNIYFDVNPLKYVYENTGGLMLPILSSKRNKALILDTLISLEKMKSYYKIEDIVLQDFKGILNLIIGIRKIDEEITIREKIDKLIDSTGLFLSNFSANGIISKRSLNLLKLTYWDNKMQISLLSNQKVILNNQLRSQYFINEPAAEKIINENNFILYNLLDTNNESHGVKKIQTLNDCIDSINIQELKYRRKYDTYNDFSMRIGPTIEVPGGSNELSVGLGAQFNISILQKKYRHNDNLVSFSSSSHDYCDMTFQMDSNSVFELNRYILKIDKETTNIINEMKSGNQYFLSVLNDLFSRKISAKINYMNLQYSYYSYKISNIHSLEEIGLRKKLMKLLSYGE